MDETNSKSGNGVKAFAAVAILAAVLTSMHFMTQPLAQRLDFMVVQLTELRTHSALEVERLRVDLKDHEGIPIHMGAADEVARFKEKFEEIETQFDWANDIANLRCNYTERILGLLWAEVMGSEFPALDYWPLNGDEK